MSKAKTPQECYKIMSDVQSDWTGCNDCKHRKVCGFSSHNEYFEESKGVKMSKEIVAYEIMECDTVVGNTLEDIVCWYHNNICDLTNDDIECMEEQDVTSTLMWYPSDSEIEFEASKDKRTYGDCKIFEGAMYQFTTIDEAFEIECEKSNYKGIPFVIASKEC